MISAFKKKPILVLLLLAFTNWVAHYFYFRRFGLYEDDYFNTVFHLTQNLDQLLYFIEYRLTHWIQGHAFTFIQPLFSFIIARVGDLHSLYIFAFIIVTANSFLFYKILKVLFKESEIFAVVGALAYVLFPPDTTKTLLICAFQLQVSFMFFLISTLLYLKGWKKLSYFIIPLCLLTYESPFMLFFAVPLFQAAFDKKFWKYYTVHVLILCFMIAAFALYRISEGESRMVETQGQPLDVIYKVLTAMILGPLMNILLFVRAPFATILSWFESPSYWFKTPLEPWYKYIFIYIVIFFAVYSTFLYKLKNNFIPRLNDNDTDKSSNNAYTYFHSLVKILFVGIVLLCLGYSVSFTHYPPTRIMGLNTSVHLAATFGGSIIFSCVCTSIVYILEKYNLKIFGILLISAYLSLLVGYGTIIQQDFARSWSLQRYFYTNIIKLCPDLNDSTVIFVTEKWYMPDTRYIYSHSTSHAWALNGIYKFPDHWNNPPRLFLKEREWADKLKVEGGKLLWDDELNFSTLKWQPIPDKNLILINYNMSTNEFTRIDTVINVNNVPITLKPKPSELKPNPVLQKGPLYEYLVFE